MIYPKFPIGPGVTFPRTPFGYMPGMHLPIGFSPQPTRPPSSGEPPRSFAPPHPQFTQSQQTPTAQPPHVEKPQTPSNKGRATPGTPKPATTPQSPHLQTAPSSQGIPPQQMPQFGRAPEPRPPSQEGSARTPSGQQDVQAMVAKHFLLSGTLVELKC